MKHSGSSKKCLYISPAFTFYTTSVVSTPISASYFRCFQFNYQGYRAIILSSPLLELSLDGWQIHAGKKTKQNTSEIFCSKAGGFN